MRKEEGDLADLRTCGEAVWEVTGWDNPIEEKIGFVEAACQNYEVLVEDKHTEKAGGVRTPNWYETRFGPKKSEAGKLGMPDKMQSAGYRLSTEIERKPDLRKVLEERILDRKVKLSLREVLGIARKES